MSPALDDVETDSAVKEHT